MKDEYIKGKGNSYVRFKIGFYAKKKLRFDHLRAKYNKSEKHISIILANIFVLATNQKIVYPSLKNKYQFYKVRGDYGKRWRIETSYREVIPFLTYTTSKIPKYVIYILLLFFYYITFG